MKHGGQIHNGIRHGRGCACPLCDPQQTRLAAAAAAARNGATSPVGRDFASLARPLEHGRGRQAPITRQRPRGSWAPDPRTVRFRGLLRDGMRATEAAEIVEREFAKPLTGGTYVQEENEND